MKTSEQVQKEFTQELAALCAKYNAEICIEEVGMAYSSQQVIGVFIPTVYDEAKHDYPIISESASFNIGQWFNKDV